MDADNKSKSFGVGGSRGRIIFLGDGTEVLTGSDDTEMFDNADEDKDLESQVSKGAASNESSATTKTDGNDTSTTQDESTTKESKKD
jgi:protein phosphatase 2C family protein 2/3